MLEEGAPLQQHGGGLADVLRTLFSIQEQKVRQSWGRDQPPILSSDLGRKGTQRGVDGGGK